MSSIDPAYEKLTVKYRVQKSKYFPQILEKLLSLEQASRPFPPKPFTPDKLKAIVRETLRQLEKQAEN